jgi:hypothetical protein
MPKELQDLRPPTKADAASYIRIRNGIGAWTIERFEDSQRGEQCSQGRYSADACREYRREFEQARAAALDDALKTLTRLHEEKLEQRASIERANEEAYEAEVDRLRVRYLSAGGTEEGFQAAKDELVEAARRQAVLEGQTQADIDYATMRSRISI